MPNNTQTYCCKICNKEIQGRQKLKCFQCHNFYHIECAAIEKRFYLMTSDEKSNWKCRRCWDTPRHTGTRRPTPRNSLSSRIPKPATKSPFGHTDIRKPIDKPVNKCFITSTPPLLSESDIQHDNILNANVFSLSVSNIGLNETVRAGNPEQRPNASTENNTMLSLSSPTLLETPSNHTILMELREFRQQVCEQFKYQEARFHEITESVRELKANVLELTSKYFTLKTDVEKTQNTVCNLHEKYKSLQIIAENNCKHLQALEETYKTSLCSSIQTSHKDTLKYDSKKDQTPLESVNSNKNIQNIATIPPPMQIVDQYIYDHPKNTYSNDLHFTENPRNDDNAQPNTAQLPKIIRGTCTVDTTLQAIQRRKQIHACFFKPETTSESLLTHLKKSCPLKYLSVTKLKLKHQHYASFVVTVQSEYFELLMNAELWPAETRISEWFRHSAAARQAAPRHPSHRRSYHDSRAHAAPRIWTRSSPSSNNVYLPPPTTPAQ
ncbi:hypothetical protein O0L34_g12836 [Tuta absoluta]|nr:hypothetical protein O0L34_g12836 [Tuta absoluta]